MVKPIADTLVDEWRVVFGDDGVEESRGVGYEHHPVFASVFGH